MLSKKFPIKSIFPGSAMKTADWQQTTDIDALRSIWSNVRMVSKGRILAVDYGEKNIGLALSDELGLTVSPLPSKPNPGQKGFLKMLQTTVRSLGIQKLVLGIPLNMDGTRGDSVLRMERLMKTLKAALRIPLIGVDERLSTIEAMEFWRNMNPRQQKKYRTVDSLAAACILERYLREN
jgi:putative Holliday junction resolvase